MNNDIDPHTGYPMKFERKTDRYSPVYVEERRTWVTYMIAIIAGCIFGVLLALSI